jgi:hypothetical protein
MIKKNLHPPQSFEIETTNNLYFENTEGIICPSCNEAITNPICHNCLGKGIFEWMSFYPNVKKKMFGKLKRYINEVNNSAISSINCVSCKNKKAALCPYCFTEGILNLLKKNKVNESIVEDFISLFNFSS